MNIVIVGDGKVGYTLSEQLSRENHNVTIIDSNQQALKNTMETLDVMGVHGNGASRSVQLEAGVQSAELLIAATSADERNMLCCLMAKALGAANTIARIRDPEYMEQLHMLRDQLGLSLVINPELATAAAIARVIRFPQAARIDTFAKGKVELVELRLPEQSPVIGKRIMDFPYVAVSKILICAIEREGEVFIPKGGFTVEQGDKLHIAGESKEISAFISAIGGASYKIRSVIIVGGGRIGYYLADMLDDRNIRVKIIDKDIERCNELCELLPRASVICGDGSDIALLESEGLDGVDAFIALTGMDEENLIMSMMAAQKGVPKVAAKVNRLNYMPMAEKMGIHTVVSPKLITADEITSYVRAIHNTMGSRVDTLYRLVGGKAEALEFTVGKDTPNIGMALSKLKLRGHLLIAAIVRRGKVIIPHGGDHIELGDSVVVISNRHGLTDLKDIFEND